MKSLHIFKPGKHTAVNGHEIHFTEADLIASAKAYDPAKHEAPLVVGHPKMDDPAYGWAKSLAYADGALVATPDQVDPAFAELVGAGRYKKFPRRSTRLNRRPTRCRAATTCDTSAFSALLRRR